MSVPEEFSGFESDPIVIECPGDTITLRQLTAADEPRYRGLIAEDPDHLLQFGDDTGRKYPTPESFLETITNPIPNRLRFGIWDADSMVGSVNIKKLDEDTAEIGYWVGGFKTGHAYAARALKSLSDYAFSRLGYSELEAHIAVGNLASRRTAEKCGFKIREERRMSDPSGQERDYWIFSKSQDLN